MDDALYKYSRLVEHVAKSRDPSRKGVRDSPGHKKMATEFLQDTMLALSKFWKERGLSEPAIQAGTPHDTVGQALQESSCSAGPGDKVEAVVPRRGGGTNSITEATDDAPTWDGYQVADQAGEETTRQDSVTQDGQVRQQRESPEEGQQYFSRVDIGMCVTEWIGRVCKQGH
jgi:hypothetical protein